MAKTRSQEDTKGKDVESEDPMEQRVSKLEKTLDQRFSILDQRFSILDQRFEELMESLGRSKLCDDQSSLDRYSPMSQKVKGSGSEGLERALDDGELVETKVASELNGIEDGTVRREANLEEELLPQFQVPISDLEHGLRFHNATSIVCEDSHYVVGCDELRDHQKSISQVSHVNGNGENVAHQVFDKKPLRVQSRRGHIKCHKTWRFKFKQGKQQRCKLRSAHQLIHRGNVMYKTLCSSAKVALMKKNKFSITWPMLNDDCFIEDDHVYQEGLPLWLLVRFKFWKFKFVDRKLQKMMREQGFSSHLKLRYYSLKRESGTKVHHANTQASKSMSDVLRTTLAPSSMLKRLLDAVGIVITTDGNAILLEIDVAHPAAKSMIELSHPQDEEVGVGTTSVIVLAGELSQPIDVKDRATVLGVVKSCIGTKFISEFGDLIADLAIDATTTISVDLGQGLREVDISDLACHYFSKAGVSTIRRLRKTDINRIAKACRAVIVNRSYELQESDVIICPLADHLKPGYVVFFTKEAGGKLERFSGLCKELKDIDVPLMSFDVWMRQTSFVVQQARRNKKIRLSKRWWFKYKYLCYSFGQESFAAPISFF